MEKQEYELWGEAARDVGILLLVFAPLDTLLRSNRGTSGDWLVAGGIAVVGLLFIFLGVKMGSST